MALVKLARLCGSLGLALLVAPGCSSAGHVCDPGATQRCVCPVGDGAQVCSADGTAWGSCTCGAADAGRVDGGSLDTGTPDASLDTGIDASRDASSDTSADGGCAVGATSATVSDVADGTIGAAVRVHLEGVVAMSRVFLVQRSGSTGTCLWGVFVSAPGLTETAPYSGTLVTSYGTMATIADSGLVAYCPVLGVSPTGSAIPDDLQPGDVLDVVAEVSSFLPSTCAATDTSVPTPRLTNACLVVRTGSTTPPAPALLSATDIARLGSQTDATGHDAWGNVLVRLDGVSASPPSTPASCATGTSVVDLYGVVRLDGSGLEVGDHLYYQGSLRSNPCYDAPHFCSTSGAFSWSHVIGFHYLDLCRWTLQPPDKCADFTPRSADCTASSC